MQNAKTKGLFKKLFQRNRIIAIFVVAVVALFSACELNQELKDFLEGQKSVPVGEIDGTLTNGQEIGLSFTVSGSAYDASGIDLVKIYIKNIAVDSTANYDANIEGTGKHIIFRRAVTFSQVGSFSIWADIKNKKGGIKKTDVYAVTVVSNASSSTNTNSTTTNDTTSPAVVIENPAQNADVGETFVFNGSAYDAGSGVATVHVKLDSGSYTTATLSGTGATKNWTYTMNLSAEGSHTCSVYAVDISNNTSGVITRNVNWVVGMPSVAITSPANNTMQTTTALTVNGTAAVDSGSIDVVQVKLNSGFYSAATGTTPTWSTNLTLAEGDNTITARAIGNNKTNTTSAITVTVDSVAPTTTGITPATGTHYTNKSSVLVGGYASDATSGVEGWYIAVDDDNYVKISSSTSLSYSVPLPSGEHTIKLYAKDNIGHSSTTNIIVVHMDTATVPFVVYVKKPSGWGTPHIWFWEEAGDDCGVNSGIWPGDAMTDATSDTDGGPGWYKWEFTGSSTHLIFNNDDSPKTGDLSREGRGWYYDESLNIASYTWYDTHPEIAVIPVITATPESPYTNNQGFDVTLEGSQSDDDIYYTGPSESMPADPTKSDTLYSSAISIPGTSGSHTYYIKAKGWNRDDGAGTVYTFTNHVDTTIDLTKPTITNNTATGHYDTAQSVNFTIYDNFGGTTTAHYTTDGSTPTTGSTFYTSGVANTGGVTGGNIAVNDTMTIRFLVKDNAGNETLSSFNYHIGAISTSRFDPRQETIYFMLPTRWFSGNEENSVGDMWCSWTVARTTVGSPEYIPDNGFTGPEDVTWRGDFEGLVKKMDYIKAMGFTCIWLTPVVQNRGPLAYHGYHAWDYTKEDTRLESPGYDFQRVIDEAHSRDMKICLDIVINHSGRFGLKDFSEIKYNTDQNLYPDPDTWTPGYEYDGLTSPGTRGGETLPPYSRLSDVRAFTAEDLTHYPYLATDMANGWLKYQWPSTESYTKTIDFVWDNGGAPGSLDYAGYQNSARRHRGHGSGFPTGAGSYDNYPEAHFDSLHEDCPDLNTENPAVQTYLIDAYKRYIDMGVDMFRVDTVMHMHKQTLNDVYWPQMLNYAHTKKAARGDADFYIFGEVANFVMNPHDKASPLREQNYTWDNSHNDCSSDNHWMNGNNYRTPDYSHKAPDASTPYHVGVLNMVAHNSFCNGAGSGYGAACGSSHMFNDATFNVWYADSHDYGPNKGETRYQGNFKEIWSMMFTFRGIPVVYYGSEIRFAQDKPNDWPGGGAGGINMSLEKTGRSYYGGHLDGTVTATDFGEYTATGEVATTLSHENAQHLRKLNMMRLAVPALQMGQYSTDGCSGGWASYKRRYTGNDTITGHFIDSFACVAVGSGGYGFSGLPAGEYVEIVKGGTTTIGEGGTISGSMGGSGHNLRIWVNRTIAQTSAAAPYNDPPSGRVGPDVSTMP